MHKIEASYTENPSIFDESLICWKIQKLYGEFSGQNFPDRILGQIGHCAVWWYELSRFQVGGTQNSWISFGYVDF